MRSRKPPTPPADEQAGRERKPGNDAHSAAETSGADVGRADELPLFDGKPRTEDVMQGALGDCGVIATIGAVARIAPDKMQDAVRDNDDGTVTVTLHEAEFTVY